MKGNTKCTCGRNSYRVCKNCSRYKAVFMLKSGYKDLKEHGQNPARYSFYSKNNKPQSNVVEKMIERLKKSYASLFSSSNVVIVYDKWQNTEVKRMYP